MDMLDIWMKETEDHHTFEMSDKFKKKEFVIEVSEAGSDGNTYIQSIIFQLIQDRVSLLDSLNIGDNVKAVFNPQVDCLGCDRLECSLMDCMNLLTPEMVFNEVDKLYIKLITFRM